MSQFVSEGELRAFVIDAYKRELRGYYQRRARGNQISEEYVVNKLKYLIAPSKNHRTGFFDELITYCQAGSFDCPRLIKAFFSTLSPANKNLEIKHSLIFTKTVQQVYDKMQPSEVECRESLDRQMAVLVTDTNMVTMLSDTPTPEVEANLMLSTNNSYTALFRCCVLSRHGKDISPWLLSGASEYRLAQVAFDKVWGSFIPERIRELGLNRRQGS